MPIDKFQTKDGYECPTCEKTLSTSLGLKQHHSKIHGESLREVEECDWCGEEFYKKPSQVGKYCSKECQMNQRSENGLPARKRRVVVQCPGCDEGFEIKYSEIGHKKYCSDSCRRGGEYIECEVCESEFYAYDTYASQARFCSQDCYGVWLSRNRSGENSPHWKGKNAVDNRPCYGPGWNERKRKSIRERDNNECISCGMSGDEHIEKFGRRLNVHHIVQARESSNPAVHNAPRNLMTLCVPCHMSVEQS